MRGATVGEAAGPEQCAGARDQGGSFVGLE
jgi:hypothetical protein